MSGNVDGKIAIDESTGEISVGALLDFETGYSLFELDIMAVNTDSSGISSTVRVAVYVDDINDNSPNCSKTLFTSSIQENKPQTSQVISLECVDVDSVGQPLSFSIFAGNDQGYFDIEPASGVIFVAGTLDAETQQEVNLVVNVSDGTFVTNINVIIVVVDINEHIPQLSPVPTLTIKEDIQVGTPVYTLTAADDDISGDTIYYSIVAGDNDGHFNVGLTTGIIQTKKQLDRESKDHFTLTVQVEDGSDINALSSTTDVDFIIDDVNDNYPSCDKSTYTTYLSEGATPQMVIQPICSDLDNTSSSELRYRIVSGNDDGLFFIDQTNGKVDLTGELDYESTVMYVLVCEIDDQGVPDNLITTIEIVVHIEPVNEFAPQFVDSDSFDKAVDETFPIGSVVTVISATDADEGENHGVIRYSFASGNDDNYFAISPSTGQIILLKHLDYETANAYALTVSVKDSLGNVDEKKSDIIVHITVVDTNDNAPLCSPSLISETYDENYQVGNALAQLNCHDDDVSEQFNTLTYEIISVNGDFSVVSQFAISTTGVLTVESEFDYESVILFNILIRVSDAGTPIQSTTSTIQLTIDNINEHSPEFVQETYTANLKEKTTIGSPLLTVEARDNDFSDTVSYYFSSESSQFNLDPQTGDIYLASDIDYDTMGPNKEILLTVFSKDDGTNPGSKSSSVSVTITIINENDGTPIFIPGVYSAIISENDATETTVTTLTATDIDDDSLTYTIVNGNDDNIFRVDQVASNGVIVISDTTLLDFETKDSYTLIVHAVDAGLLTGTTTVAIKVTGYNEHTPSLQSLSSTQTILENSPLGHNIIDLDAHDTDVGLDGDIYYKIISGSTEHFIIDQTTGIVTLAGILDRESTESYVIEILVADGGIEPGKVYDFIRYLSY